VNVCKRLSGLGTCACDMYMAVPLAREHSMHAVVIEWALSDICSTLPAI
jgi:hypothetical protein